MAWKEEVNLNQQVFVHIVSFCMAACLIMMTNEFVSYKFGTGDPTRLGAQVISGVGFLGAGTILITDKRRLRV